MRCQSSLRTKRLSSLVLRRLVGVLCGVLPEVPDREFAIGDGCGPTTEGRPGMDRGLVIGVRAPWTPVVPAPNRFRTFASAQGALSRLSLGATTRGKRHSVVQPVHAGHPLPSPVPRPRPEKGGRLEQSGSGCWHWRGCGRYSQEWQMWRRTH